MRAHATLMALLILTVSVAQDQEEVTSKDSEQFYGQPSDNETRIAKWMLLYQQGALFLMKLKSIDALPGIPGDSHGQLDSGVEDRRYLKDLDKLFPFEVTLSLSVEGDANNAYLFVLRKDGGDLPWKMVSAFRQDIASREHYPLPLPSDEQSLEANRLMSD